VLYLTQTIGNVAHGHLMPKEGIMNSNETLAKFRAWDIEFSQIFWRRIEEIGGVIIAVTGTIAFIGLLFYTVIGVIFVIVLATLLTRFNRPMGLELMMSIVGITFMIISDFIFMATVMAAPNLPALGLSILVFSAGVFLWYRNTFGWCRMR